MPKDILKCEAHQLNVTWWNSKCVIVGYLGWRVRLKKKKFCIEILYHLSPTVFVIKAKGSRDLGLVLYWRLLFGQWERELQCTSWCVGYNTNSIILISYFTILLNKINIICILHILILLVNVESMLILMSFRFFF